MSLTSFFIDLHGCAKNQVDGEIIAGHLIKAGYEQKSEASTADIIIVNSCGFIESAKKESIDAVCSIRATYPNKKIILTGCLSERYSQMLNDSMPELDGIFGNGDLSKIVEVVNKISNGKKVSEVYKQEGICSGKRPVLFNYSSSAFVKITEGCSNHCSFCAIPLIRGELRSRKAVEIIDEIKQLLDNGIYEINLIGQDLAAYGSGKGDDVFGNGETPLPLIDSNGNNLGTKTPSGLSLLLSEISKLNGNFAIRLLYIHPDHFNKDIIDILKKDNRFIKYFDIPFQSGDDEIIKKMNRKGSAHSYKSIIEILRNELSSCTIRTTFLTGFPGETDENAENTKQFLKSIQPDWSGCFAYSREEDTPAYNMKNRVSKKNAENRASELESIQSDITMKRLQQYVDSEVDVLVEEVINPPEGEEDTEGLAIGRADFQAPEVDGNIVIRYQRDNDVESDSVQSGNVVKVKIISVNGIDLDSQFIQIVKKSVKKEIKYLYS